MEVYVDFCKGVYLCDGTVNVSHTDDMLSSALYITLVDLVDNAVDMLSGPGICIKIIMDTQPSRTHILQYQSITFLACRKQGLLLSQTYVYSNSA